MKKQIIGIFMLIGVLFCLNSLICRAQVYNYQYYSNPGGSYSYKNYSNYGFSFPGTGSYYYYNGSNMDQILRNFDSIIQQLFSQSYNSYYKNYSYNMTPQKPQYYNNRQVPYSNNYSGSQGYGDIEPAPSYNSNPNIYY